MATKRFQTARRTTAHDSPTTEGLSALTAEELAELIDSIREDEIAAAIAGCTECDPEYND